MLWNLYKDNNSFIMCQTLTKYSEYLMSIMLCQNNEYRMLNEIEHINVVKKSLKKNNNYLLISSLYSLQHWMFIIVWTCADNRM